MAKKVKVGNTKKSTVQFSTTPIADNQSDIDSNTSAVNDQLRHMLNVKKQHADILNKSVTPVTRRADLKGKYEKSKVVISSKTNQDTFNGAETKGYRRLSDAELREISQIDPYIAAIISTRCSQGAVIARASESKFDKGTRILDLNPISLEDFENDQKFEAAKKAREAHSKSIMNWIWNCGTDDKDIINEIYSDPRSDKMFKKCTLADYMVAQIRNLLTFGRAGTHVIRNADGMPVAFRPMTIETIMPNIEKNDVHMGNGRNTMDASIEDVNAYNALPEDERPAAYVQVIEGSNVNFFTEQDMQIDYLQKQALFDLRQYPLSPIEQAIYMVFVHQNTLSYLRNQFVKGLGSKGVLTIESTDITGELSAEDLDALRADFHNFLMRTDNSATTPIISGPVKVGWIPMTSTPRDMEFLQVEEHVIRALCSAFMTSPQEMGYGHLSIGQGGLTQSNKQEEIVRGEERGLRSILDIIYDRLNAILYENFPEAEENFRISFTGVGEDTRDAVIQRHNQELQTTATLSSLWNDSEKTEPIPVGGNVPLAPLYHSSVVRFLKYGYYMEKFMGMEGWASKPEYDFIIDPALDAAYQARIANNNQMIRQQSELQIQSQQQQLDSMEQQASAMEQQQEMAQQQPEQPPQPAPGQPQADPAQKSLREEYINRSNALQKSMGTYFSEWMKIHT